MIQEKQNFLRQSILEQGYDQQAFCDFMQQRRDNWADLAAWTMQELQSLVTEFKLLCDQQAQTFAQRDGEKQRPSQFDQEELKNEPKEENEERDEKQLTQQQIQKRKKEQELQKQFVVLTHEEIASQLIQKQESVYYDHYKVRDQAMTKTIRTQPLLNRYANLISVYVEQAQIISYGGVFGLGQTTEYQYVIKIPELKWKVQRKASDLVWLRQKLIIFFPHCSVPFFKNYKKTTGAPRQQKKRIRMVTTFVEQIIAMPQLLNTKLFQGFFKFVQAGKFQNFKRDIGASKFLKVVSNIPSPTGSHTLRLGSGITLFCEQIEKAFNRQQAILGHIDRSACELVADLQKVGKTMVALSGHMKRLHSVFADFNGSVPEGRLEGPSQLFIGLNNCLLDWGCEMKGLSDKINFGFRNLFKSSKQERTALVEHLRRRAEAEDEYLRYRIGLTQKKDRLFQTKDIRRWQIPKSLLDAAIKNKDQLFKDRAMAEKYLCLNSTHSMQNLRNWYAFMNEQTFSGLKGLVQRMCERMRRELIQVTDQMRHSLHLQKQVLGPLKGLSPWKTVS